MRPRAIRRFADDCETLPSNPARSDSATSRRTPRARTLHPRTASARPSRAPRPASRNTAKFRSAASSTGKRVPPIQRDAHLRCCVPPSFSRNSVTRLPTTAARYLAVDRMSSIGCTSAAAVVLASSTSDGSSGFPSSSVRFRSNEWASGRRFRERCAHRGRFHSPIAPAPPCTPWRRLARCAFRLFACTKYIRQNRRGSTRRGSVRPLPASSSCIRCERSNRALAVRRARKPESDRPHTPATRARNPPPAMH